MNVVQLVIKDSEIIVKNPEILNKRREAIPYDPRYPNQNQTKNCYQNYLDFFRCQKIKGEDYKPCFWYKTAYKELCPPSWINKWNEQRQKGTFPGRI